MRPRRVFVFDLDGTLLDARARQVDVLMKACQALAELAPDPDQFWDHKRNGDSTVEALARMGYAAARARRIADWWKEHVEDVAMLRGDRPLPGAVDAVDLCKRGGFSAFVLTARANPTSAREQVEQSALGPAIDTIQVVEPGDAAAQKARWLTEWRALAMVGDTEADANAAATAGVPFLAVCSGQRSRAYLQALSPVVYDDARTAVRQWLEARRSIG